ncbi:MAG: hypothetical protein ABSG52_14470 [Terriglobales bacterium]|jgi:hypothetical protein
MGLCKRRPEKKISPKLFAEARVRGARVEEAMLRAGYSQSSAKRGWTQVSKKCKEAYAVALNMTLAELEKTGGKLTPDQRAKVIRGKALRNIAEGVDESIGSMKLLGQDKELAMFTPDNLTGIIIISAPATIPALPAIDTAPIDDDAAIVRGRFFSAIPEDAAWRGSPEGQEARHRLEAKGLL